MNHVPETPATPPLTPDVIAAYSDPNWFYDIRGFFILTFAYQSSLWRQIRFFGNNMGVRHLEIAVGSGTLLALILLWRRLKHAPLSQITATDYVPSMLAGARTRFRRHPHITVELADATALPYADQVFDTVNIANSLHCFSDIEAGLRESLRVLKPGGTFGANCILIPRGESLRQKIARRINTWGQKKGILYSAYDEADIKEKIRAAGFVIIEETIAGNTYYVLASRPSA